VGMKNLFIIFLFIFVSFKSYSNEIENKGLICNSFEKKPKILKDNGFLYSAVKDVFSYGFWFNKIESFGDQGAFKDIFKDVLKNEHGDLEIWKETIKSCNNKSDSWDSDCNSYVFEKNETNNPTYEVTDFYIKINPYGKNSISDNMQIDRLNLYAKKSFSSKYKYWCKAYKDKKIFLKEIYGMPYEVYIKEKEQEKKEIDKEYNNKLKKRIF
jgi:hypothetical protein